MHGEQYYRYIAAFISATMRGKEKLRLELLTAAEDPPGQAYIKQVDVTKHRKISESSPSDQTRSILTYSITSLSIVIMQAKMSAYAEAWRAGDVEKILSFFADDAEYQVVGECSPY